MRRISGRTPSTPEMAIADDWPGPGRRPLHSGRHPSWRGRTVEVAADAWEPATGPVGEYVHSFAWLRSRGRRRRRALEGAELIVGWIDSHERWSREAWRLTSRVNGSRRGSATSMPFGTRAKRKRSSGSQTASRYRFGTWEATSSRSDGSGRLFALHGRSRALSACSEPRPS